VYEIRIYETGINKLGIIEFRVHTSELFDNRNYLLANDKKAIFQVHDGSDKK
jgi:hypothetical protein